MMFMTARYDIDPVPFMEFLTLICLAFVVGASATSAISGWKRGSIEEAEIKKDIMGDLEDIYDGDKD